MPPALHKFLLTLYIYGHVAGDDFRPTPIPLDEWRPDESRGRAGTLHETIKTAAPPTIVVIPAHYWEDALRHSVYLTLVRDKIDQLIAKGEVIAPNSSPNLRNSEVDDQDLWEKIKAAPFERLKEVEPTTYGDVTILARGRLLEERGGFRFAEDDKSKEKCDNEQCMDGVKAFWSVKRVRQRDQEISPGRYHYELTFSVMSQLPKKQKKPYEHPIRTFTVQENDKGFEPTKANIRLPTPTQVSRPERAIWFHKNIQVPQHTKRPQSGLDRLFSSWFDDDDDDEPVYNPPRRQKQISYHPSLPQYSNFGYFGGANLEHYTQKPVPYPYRPQFGRYQSHPLTTPPIGHLPYNLEPDLGGINNPYISQSDYKASGINNIQRTTRPAVLPTPLPLLPTPSREPYVKKTTAKNDIFDNVTNAPDIDSVHKQHTAKTNVKMSPFPEQLRPPIYNAPPGVFVTLDKKPFKPLPPLKAPNVKHLRSKKPIDFRPSPQVLDVQFSEPDPLFDTVFRPITVKYFEDNDTSEKIPTGEDNEKGEESIRKTTVTVKRPPQKQDNKKKSHRITTTVPDIITANNNPEQADDMEWADILGIFTKTTPMEAQKEKPKIEQTTTQLPTTSVTVTTTSLQTTTATSTAAPSTTVPSTVKPKKRTRPPPKFHKTEKIKKHKRITTTTTTTTNAPSTTKTTEEKKRKKLKQELTNQASVTPTTKPKWEPSSKTSTTTPFSTIGTTTTAYPTTTTKSTTTTKAIPDEPPSTTARSKSANRFRQSTLMIKGTSVKHDRWTVTSPLPEKAKGQSLHSSFPYRRKGSNFNGYISSTAKTLDESRNIHGHSDGTTTERTTSPKNEETTVKNIEPTSAVAPTSDDEMNETPMDVVEEFVIEEKNEENYEESRDHSEYIFPQPSEINDNKNNEISSIEPVSTTESITSTTLRPLVKKKKCKKKHQSINKKNESDNIHEIKDITTTIAPSTTPLTTPSLLEDLLNDFSFEDAKSETQSTTLKQDQDEEQNQAHEQYFEVNDDLEELLDSLKNDKYENVPEDYDEEDDNNDDDDDEEEKEHPFEEEDTSFQSTNDSPQYSQKDYEDDEKRPFTLLELMAME